LSGRGLCDGVITRPEESYRLWYVGLCDVETSWMRRLWPLGAVVPNKQNRSYNLEDNRRTPFIMPTKCTSLINTNIEVASPTCFGIYVYHLQGEHSASS